MFFTTETQKSRLLNENICVIELHFNRFFCLYNKLLHKLSHNVKCFIIVLYVYDVAWCMAVSVYKLFDNICKVSL